MPSRDMSALAEEAAAPSKAAAAEGGDLDDLYGGMEEDAKAEPQQQNQQQRKRTAAERAAHAAAEAERSARARLVAGTPVRQPRDVPVIRDGDFAVFDMNGEKLSIQHVRASG